jgi:hypothetical protein
VVSGNVKAKVEPTLKPQEAGPVGMEMMSVTHGRSGPAG